MNVYFFSIRLDQLLPSTGLPDDYYYYKVQLGITLSLLFFNTATLGVENTTFMHTT